MTKIPKKYLQIKKLKMYYFIYKDFFTTKHP